MTITVYSCSDDFRVMDKTLTQVATLSNVEIYGSCSVSTPVLKLANASSQLPQFNYVYIPNFGRYYHVTDIVADSGGMVYVHCSVDARYTWRDQIRNCPCNVLRNEGIGKPTMIIDQQLPVLQNTENIVSKRANGTVFMGDSVGDAFNYVLITR